MDRKGHKVANLYTNWKQANNNNTNPITYLINQIFREKEREKLLPSTLEAKTVFFVANLKLLILLYEIL